MEGAHDEASSDDRELKARLQEMDDFAFEEFIADLWERKGWTTEIEGGSNDRDVDVHAFQSYPRTIRSY